MLKKIAERFVRSIDCGVVAFVNELYQFKVLAPLDEPLQDEITTKWPESNIHWPGPASNDEIAALIAAQDAQIREYALRTRTPFDSADDVARNGTCGAAADYSSPAPVDAPDAGAGLLPISADELHYAASAIRCWVLGTAIDGFNPDYFAALADRLSTAALDLTPVSN